MSDDLIKRSDAINALCDITNNSDMPEDWHRGMSVAISALYRVPSADRPQGEWIPCSERLPKEEKGVYLICTDYGYMCSCRWTNDVYGLGANEWSAWGWCRLDVPQYSRVVAWMDLKPWKGADDDTI